MRTTVMAPLALGISCIALGAGLTASLATPVAHPPTPTPTVAVDPGVQEALTRLTRELITLRAELARRPARVQRSTAPAVVAAPVPSVSPVSSTEPVARLDSTPAPPRSHFPSSGLVVSSQPPPRTVPFKSEPSERLDLWAEHRFWSYQRILDTYGPPTRASSSSGGVDWTYERIQPDGTGNWLVLHFHDGVLIHCRQE